jgi:hypothetical protein
MRSRIGTILNAHRFEMQLDCDIRYLAIQWQQFLLQAVERAGARGAIRVAEAVEIALHRLQQLLELALERLLVVSGGGDCLHGRHACEVEVCALSKVRGEFESIRSETGEARTRPKFGCGSSKSQWLHRLHARCIQSSVINSVQPRRRFAKGKDVAFVKAHRVRDC